MDLKYARITQRQFGNSLDRIQEQSNDIVSEKKLLADHLSSSAATNTSSMVSSKQECSCSIKSNSNKEQQSTFDNLDVNSFGKRCSFDEITQTQQLATLEIKNDIPKDKETMIIKLDLHISLLQQQIQDSEATLRQMKKSFQQRSALASSVSASNNRLQERKVEDLELFLGKIENKLFELTSEYKKEKKELKNTITKLKNSLKQKEQSFNELKKLHKLNVEDLDKRKNRVNKLKRHIAGLPTTEESNRLKTEVHLLRNERDCLVTEMSENKNKLELEIISITEKEAQILSLNKDVHRQHKAIDNLQQKLLKSGKSQENLRALERVELQDLRAEVLNLKKEKRDGVIRLRNLERQYKQKEERLKIELDNLNAQVKVAEEMNETVREELQAKAMLSHKVHSSMKKLATQNQQLADEKLKLQKKFKHLKRVTINSEEVAQSSSELLRETSLAAQDLRCVTQVLLQTANGLNPNISALLGVRSESSGWEEELADDQDSKLTFKGSFSTTVVKKRLLDMRQMQKDISQLRSTFTDQYATSIKNNCATQ